MCEQESTHLVHAEEDTLGGEVKQRADELCRHVHWHDQLLATLTTKDGVAQQSLWHKLGAATVPSTSPVNIHSQTMGGQRLLLTQPTQQLPTQNLPSVTKLMTEVRNHMFGMKSGKHGWMMLLLLDFFHARLSWERLEESETPGGAVRGGNYTFRLCCRYHNDLAFRWAVVWSILKFH